MKKLLLTTTILLSACATKHIEHPIHLQHIDNYVRDIAHTKDFWVQHDWIEVMRRQPVKSGTGTPSYEVMQGINNQCNAKPYKFVKTWPTPKEFAAAPYGDCKGYSICKYYALRKAGWKAKDLNLWAGDYSHVPHLTLVAALNGKQYVLDAGAASNLPEAKNYFYKQFQPAYRFNENGWDTK